MDWLHGLLFTARRSVRPHLAAASRRAVNTSYVERSNGTLRQMDAHLRRKSPTFAKSLRWLNAKLAFVIAWYNFVRPHATLSRNPDQSKTPRTPAMAAGILNHPWSISELMTSTWGL